MMFNYVRHGEVIHIYRLDQQNKVQKPQLPMHEIYELARKTYIKNLTFIFNLFFEYGFLNAVDKGEEGYFSQMFEQTTFQKNQALIQDNKRECWQEQPSNASHVPYHKSVHHYFDFLSREHNNLDSVKFVNFNKQFEGCDSKEKGYSWIILSIFKLEDLEKAMIEIFNDIEFRILYNRKESFVWNYKSEVYECMNYLKQQPGKFYFKCKIIEDFIRHLDEKQAKSALNTQLLGGPQGGDRHASVSQATEALDQGQHREKSHTVAGGSEAVMMGDFFALQEFGSTEQREPSEPEIEEPMEQDIEPSIILGDENSSNKSSIIVRLSNDNEASPEAKRIFTQLNDTDVESIQGGLTSGRKNTLSRLSTPLMQNRSLNMRNNSIDRSSKVNGCNDSFELDHDNSMPTAFAMDMRTPNLIDNFNDSVEENKSAPEAFPCPGSEIPADEANIQLNLSVFEHQDDREPSLGSNFQGQPDNLISNLPKKDKEAKVEIIELIQIGKNNIQVVGTPQSNPANFILLTSNLQHVKLQDNKLVLIEKRNEEGLPDEEGDQHFSSLVSSTESLITNSNRKHFRMMVKSQVPWASNLMRLVPVTNSDIVFNNEFK